MNISQKSHIFVYCFGFVNFNLIHMKRIYTSFFKMMLPLLLLFCSVEHAMAITEVHVDKAGTLSTLLTTSESALKITGPLNGTDIKHLRGLINAGNVTDLDISGASIVSGGVAYVDNFKTADNVIGESMFKGCAKLKTIQLPSTITEIQTRAFVDGGLRKIDIPDGVSRIGGDAFAYISSLDTVIIGRGVASYGQGVFYSSSVKIAYVKSTTPAGAPAYFFSSHPTICVYTSALEDYLESGWTEHGTIVGGLEEIFSQGGDYTTIVNNLRSNYFEDAACTQLKAEYLAMSDEELTAAFTEGGMPSFMVDIALKIKNDTWAAYEKDFRIHSYNAYSDAQYWNEKLMSTGGSYMGNPTGIYANGLDSLFVFVDSDIPEDATLYMRGCVGNDLITSAKTGKRLRKGLNIVDGSKDALYYILYIADTKSMKKTLDEWPDIKIHIQGGKVNGYYDVARHSDQAYVDLLNAAELELFTVKSTHALFNFRTSAYKQLWPKTIDRSIEFFDSATVWMHSLMGIRAEVANGERDCAPYYISGGDAIAPLYYNNPNFAIQGDEGDVGYANSTWYRTMYTSLDAVRNTFCVDNRHMDGGWVVGHEGGHNNQGAINLEGCTEGSNDLFSNLCCFLFGRIATRGESLSFFMNQYADHMPFYARNGKGRMYYNLYLYYHQGQKKTSFYPELFKALREDRLKLYNPDATSGNQSVLKFVRKACEVAQEDLSDYFRIWGFFEPMTRQYIEDYGDHQLTVSKTAINNTLKKVAVYPKNRSLLFIEDRVEKLYTTDMFSTPGQLRQGYEDIEQYGDLGQFTDYLAGASEPASYTYIQSDSLYQMKGSGGVGFLMLDADSNFVYAANDLNFYVPSSIANSSEFTIYSVDADGTLREVTKSGDGTQYVAMTTAGTLADSLTTEAIKAVISGPINGKDIKYLRQLINEHSLSSLDLSNATIKSGGNYDDSHVSVADGIGIRAFSDCHNLVNVELPTSITRVLSQAFVSTGLEKVYIPENVTSLGEDAFAYCGYLEQVVIGSKMKTLSKGSFYSSPVKDVYVYATTPPNVDASYVFSSNPTVHVFQASLAAYKASRWDEYAGKIVGDLDDYVSVQQPQLDVEDAEADAPFYDLLGRTVEELQPGQIYIRNGKKVLIK